MNPARFPPPTQTVSGRVRILSIKCHQFFFSVSISVTLLSEELDVCGKVQMSSVGPETRTNPGTTPIPPLGEGYLTGPFFKRSNIEARAYQQTIAQRALEGNLLVILPTALGKTIISAIAAARLLERSEGKILVLAPTRPLVHQHRDTFLKVLEISREELLTFTGTVSAQRRRRLWSQRGVRIVFSTPQVIWNDLRAGRYDLSDVAQVVFDEAHRARKKYAYTFIAERYMEEASHPLILAMTASPGGKTEAVREICRNLFIERVEFRNEGDPDVEPYVHSIKTEWRKVKLPREYSEIVRPLREMLRDRLSKLRGFVRKPIERVGRKDLLELGDRLRLMLAEAAEGQRGPIYGLIGLQSGCLTLSHAIELLETQGLTSLRAFLERTSQKSNERKFLRGLVRDPLFVELERSVERYAEIEHPKLALLKKAVSGKLESSSSSRILIFTQYRDTAAWLAGQLKGLQGVSAERFVGQADRFNDPGLNQAEQAEILKAFREGKLNVLCATSIAEEGLDIPQVDLVIFYEPIPSEIRYIQRRGRTGRLRVGEVLILAAENTLDMVYYWSSLQRVKKMRKLVSELNTELQSIPRRADAVISPPVGNKRNPTPSFPAGPEQKPDEGPDASWREVGRALRWLTQRVARSGREFTFTELIGDAGAEGFRPDAVLAAILKLESDGILYRPREGAVASALEVPCPTPTYSLYELEVERVFPGRAVVWVNGKWRARLEGREGPEQPGLVRKGAKLTVRGELYREGDTLCLRVQEYLGERSA